MSLIPVSTVRTSAESIGLSNASDEVLTLLAQDLDYRVRQLAQDAAKFMYHARRTKLSVGDINMALRVRRAEPLYGYDPNEALSFRLVPNSSLYYVPDEELDLDTVLHEPLPKLPPPISLTCHWLALEGVQPQIPENPIIHDRSLSLSASRENPALMGQGPSSRKQVQEESDTKPLVKHVLSKELQLYYDTIAADLIGEKDAAVRAALDALRSDAGIQQLVPYFVQFIADMVPKNLRALGILLVLVKAADSLLNNPNLFIEPYLHQLMPPILTCVVGKRLSEQPGEDHWGLREQAARLVSQICASYGDVYATLRPRITKTLTKTLLDADKPFATHYGSILALSGMGPNTFESVVVPNLRSYLDALQGNARPDSEYAEADKQRVFAALKSAAAEWLQSRDEHDDPISKELIELFRLDHQ